MNSSCNKIGLIRDLKLRKWAILGFIIISFAGLISFLRATEVSLITPFLYAIYILTTVYVLRFAKVDIFSPLMFFIFFSFLGFGLKLPLLNVFPDLAFFTNPVFHYNFYYKSSTIALAFAVFLAGYVAFIVGFKVVKQGIKVGILERSSHPLGLAILSAVLIVASFYFRSRYLVGVPGFNVALVEHAGYIYYPLLYGAIITTGLAFYSALIRNSKFYTIIGLVLFGGSALSEILLGWKGGMIHAALIMLIIYYYVSSYRFRNLKAKVRHSVVALISLLFGATIVLYPLIEYYRHAVLISSGQANILSFGNIIKTISPNVFQSLGSIIMRASGLVNLVAITAYFQQGMWGHVAGLPYFFSNLFGMGIPPEQFYTWNILGESRDIIVTYAPTGWGTLYIYGGVIAVIIGMILIGMLSKFLYLTFLSNVILRDGRWIVFYTIFMVKIFWPVVFEGTMLKQKDLIALLVVYIFSILILNVTHSKLHAKAVSRRTA